MRNRLSSITTPTRRNALLWVFLATCGMGMLDAAAYLAGTGPVAGRAAEAMRYALPPALLLAAATAPFRAWEYLRPRRLPCPRWVHLIPPASYAALCLLLSAWSLRERLESLAVVGAAGMGALVLANLGLLARQSLLKPAPAPRNPKQRFLTPFSPLFLSSPALGINRRAARPGCPP